MLLLPADPSAGIHAVGPADAVASTRYPPPATRCRRRCRAAGATAPIARARSRRSPTRTGRRPADRARETELHDVAIVGVDLDVRRGGERPRHGVGGEEVRQQAVDVGGAPHVAPARTCTAPRRSARAAPPRWNARGRLARDQGQVAAVGLPRLDLRKHRRPSSRRSSAASARRSRRPAPTARTRRRR